MTCITARDSGLYLSSQCLFTLLGKIGSVVYADFTCCRIWIDHSIALSDHAPVCLDISVGMPIDDFTRSSTCLLHINNAYLEHAQFWQLIKISITPLRLHAQEDIDFSWHSLVTRIQAVIQDYGKGYLAAIMEQLHWAKV